MWVRKQWPPSHPTEIPLVVAQGAAYLERE
jgi:hypothetical protein